MEHYSVLVQKRKLKLLQKKSQVIDSFQKLVRASGGLVIRNCALCGSSLEDANLLADSDRYGFDYFPVSCDNCGLVQQKEYYSPDILEIFYSEIYRNVYDTGSPGDLFQLQRKTNKPWKWVTENAELDPQKLEGERGLSVLDLGCGAGGSLLEFKHHGWTVMGLDFDARYVRFGIDQGLDLRLGGLEALGADQRFDLIIVSHVLEHVEPALFLASIVRHLEPNGRVYVEVPSLESVSRGAYGFSLGNYWQNAHLIHFTLPHLRAFAGKAQLRVEAINDYLQATLVLEQDWEVELDYKELKGTTEALLRKINRFQLLKRSLSPFVSILVRTASFLRLNQIVRHLIFPNKV